MCVGHCPGLRTIKSYRKLVILQPKTTILSIYFACILQRNCYFRVRRIVVQLRKPNRRHKRDPDRDLSNRTAGILRSRTFSIHRRNSTAGCIDRVVLGICLHPSRFSKIKINKTIYYLNMLTLTTVFLLTLDKSIGESVL